MRRSACLMTCAVVGVLTLGCRAATGPDTAPLTFSLAANYPAFDADRSWTFLVDGSPIANAEIGSGGAVTQQVALGNRVIAWHWNRPAGTANSPPATVMTLLRGGSYGVRINCP